MRANAFSRQRSLINMSQRSYRAASDQTFYAKDLIFEERKELLPKPGADHQYVFGALTTDYMLHLDYDRDNGGW